METEIIILLAGMGGALIGVLGQIVSNYFQHKQQIKRIFYQKKLELFLEITAELENESKKYFVILRKILSKKKITKNHIKEFKSEHESFEKKQTNFKIDLFDGKTINEIARDYYKNIINIKKFLEKEKFHQEKIEELKNSLITYNIKFVDELKKELQI